MRNSAALLYKVIIAILYLLIFLCAILSISSLILIHKISYELFRNYLIAKLAIPPDKYYLITINKFNLFVLSGYIISLILLIFSILLFTFRKAIANKLGDFATAVAAFFLEVYQELSAVKNDSPIYLLVILITFLVSILLRLHYINQPIRYDEAVTFLIYGIRPAYLCLLYYHAPNNHIFHSLLVHFSYKVFGEGLFAVRFPALISGICIIPASYLVSRLFYNKYAALLTASLVATSSILIEYSTNSRGYSLVTLITLTLFALGYYLTKHNNFAGWLIFALFSALGFYTIPIMLYPFGLVIIWLFWVFGFNIPENRYQNIKSLIIAILVTCLITLALYAPIFAASGLRSVIANDYVKPLEISNFLRKLPVSLISTFALWNRDLPKIISLILMLGFIISVLFYNKIFHYKANLILATLIWIMPLLILQRVTPFQRVWLFLLPLYIMLACSGITYLLLTILPKKDYLIQTTFYTISLLLIIINSYGIISNNSILQSTETGTLIDGEKMTRFLKGTMSKDTKIVAQVPADFILKYYFFINKLPLNHFDLDRKSITTKKLIVVTNKAFNQDLKHVLNKRQMDISQYTAKELKDFNSGTLYEIYRTPPL